MADRMIQVPVSLQPEPRAEAEFRFSVKTGEELRLYQPTPSAEPVCACGHAEFDHGHSDGDGCLHCPCKELIATQPRIEDMAPGTRFVAQLHAVYSETPPSRIW